MKPVPASCVFFTESPAETEAMGETIGRCLLSRSVADESTIAGSGRSTLDRPATAADLLLLQGPLGAGKTCFVRGLARGLGATTVPRSPTFALHRSYPGRRLLHHLDLYRLNAANLDEIGFEDLLAEPSVVAVEWGDRLGARTPPDAVHLLFTSQSDDTRRIVIEGPAGLVERLHMALQQSSGVD
jgi:tRNA threonylcarbamoyladenosine biosynthesis protein TsaE